jgi:23S rRNA (uracil-5-)-methyltransferase RumA
MRSKEFRNAILASARSGPEVPPVCQHADECGGCAFQNRDYNAQIAAKTAILRQIWNEGGYQELPIEVVGSPEIFAYRTRMDYVATKGRFGLRRSGKFNYIVEMQECHLIPPSAFQIAKTIWERSQALGLPDYNIRSHEGFLRYIVVRRSPVNQLMLAAVTSEAPHDAQMEQLAELALSHEEVVSFYWLINDSLTDISFGTPKRYWGEAYLPMRVGQHMLDIGPNTFFQNNVHLLDGLLDAVKEAVGVWSDQHNGQLPRLADLYGGVGTIALYLADQAQSVVSVEEVEESSQLARHNIRRNNLSNIEEVHADTLSYLRQTPADSFDVIVVDPPRTGLGPEVCNELLRIGAERIVYVSCNPLTQLEDAQILQQNYDLLSLRGYDMFPHTPHVEALGIWQRRDTTNR